MAENFDERYERSLHLIDRLSAEVQADIKESREFRQEMREMREESRKDREESRKDREESRGRMDRLEAILHEFIEDGKRLSKDTARSMEQTNKRLESLGIAQDRAAEDRLALRAAMESLARTVERTSQTVENLCTAQGQAAEDRLELRADMQNLAKTVERTSQTVENLCTAQDRAAEDRLALRAAMESLARTVEKTSQTVERTSQTVDNLSITRDQDEESSLRLKTRMESLTRTVERTSQTVDNLGITRDQDEESSLRLGVRMKSLARTVERTNQTMEKLGIIQGQVAEDLFYRNLPVLLKDYHITRKDLLRNIIGEMKREYDLVAVNSSHIFVFEVKNKLRSDDIERFHDVQLPDFKLNFPDYANHTVYGGIGALVVRDDLQRRAEKLGLFVLTQGENESAHLHTPRKLLEF